jgi:peptide/nickel transport system substrate-binding protein
MKRLGSLVVVLALLALIVVPVLAQEGTTLGPGEGAPIVAGNFGGDISTTNPLLVNDGSSQDIVSRIYPLFIGFDPDSGLPAPGAARSLATDWSFSDDGLVMTVTLRSDMTWSDGTPVTAADVKYAYDAVVSGDVDSPITSFVEPYIATLEAPDPNTVVITFNEFDCTTVQVAANLAVVPAHHFQTIYPTFADINAESEENLNPTVTAGPYNFRNFRPGEQVTLVANPEYTDTPAGYVVPEGFIYKNVTDQLVWVEQFLAGEITYVDSVPEDREAEMAERAAAGEFQYYKTPSTGWQVLLFNTADPAEAQAGRDEDGNLIEQNPHPVFGDLRVRQAFVHAIDHAALNAGAFSGNGSPVGGMMLPQSWAYNEALAPYAYDPELAMSLLDEAGWVDDDNDPATPRVAQGVPTVEDGTVLEFALTTFTGNPSVDSSAILMADQLTNVGFQVNLDVIEFGPMVDKLLGQTYDALMVFWGVGAQSPQDMIDLLGSTSDQPGSGFGVTSFYNQEFEDLMAEARALPGCDQAARKALYDQAQQIVYDNVPMFFVNTSLVPIAVSNGVPNFEPRRNGVFWNQAAWAIAPQ